MIHLCSSGEFLPHRNIHLMHLYASPTEGNENTLSFQDQLSQSALQFDKTLLRKIENADFNLKEYEGYSFNISNAI